ncbi:MAG: diguanylate cyclase [Sneathiella sp.]
MGLLSSLQFVRNADQKTSKARSGVSLKNCQRFLDTFPGPAFIVNDHLETISANQQADVLLTTLRARATGKLATSIQKAIRSGAPEHYTFTYGSDEDLAVMDLTLMPMSETPEHLLVTGKDVTMQRNLTNALVTSRQLFKDLVTCTAEFVWETDSAGCFRYVSPRGAIGFTAAELDGRLARNLMIEPEMQEMKSSGGNNPFESREPVEDQVIWLRDRAEALACMRISAIPVFNEEGSWVGCRGAGHDITGEMAQRTRLDKMAAEEKILSKIIDAIRQEIDPLKLFEIAGRGACEALNSTRILLVRRNPSGSTDIMFRTGVEEKTEKALLAWFSKDPGDCTAQDSLTELVDGDWRLFVSPILSGDKMEGAIVLVRRKEAIELEDGEARLLRLLSEHLGVALIQIKAREKLEQLSRTDELSGLLNRRAFHEDVAKRLKHNQRSGAMGALFYIDLDNFKPVNDRFGHEKGDEVLIGVSHLLVENSRVGDMVARLGGDEFAMWLEEISLEKAIEKAEAMQLQCAEISKEMAITDPSLSFSIGIAMAKGEDREFLDDLLAKADAAMYEVKARGKGTFSVAGTAGEDGRNDA